MRKNVKARIVWTKNNRVKKIPLLGTRYCPIIIFDGMKERGDTYWSADFIVSEVDNQLTSIIDLSFLSENAPKEYLVINGRFKLYEGNILVAEGIIIE